MSELRDKLKAVSWIETPRADRVLLTTEAERVAKAHFGPEIEALRRANVGQQLAWREQAQEWADQAAALRAENEQLRRLIRRIARLLPGPRGREVIFGQGQAALLAEVLAPSSEPEIQIPTVFYPPEQVSE